MADKKTPGADLGIGESISKHHQNTAYAWFVAFCVIFASLAYVMISRAVSPGMAAIIEYFGEDTVWGGSLSSLMGMISAIVVLPLGALATRFSAKWMAVIALTLIALGGFGAASVTDAGLFYAMRVVQGLGYGTMSVVGATMITRWFDMDHRGLPMGIYGANVGIGGFIINFTATPLMASAGWQGLFIFVAIWAAIGMVLYLVFVQDWPAEGKILEQKSDKPAKKAKFTDTFKKPAIWAMALIFLLLGIGQQGVGVFMPMIITQLAGADAATANTMNSFISLSVILCTIIAGFIYDRVVAKNKSKRGMLVLALVIVGVATQFCLLTFVSNLATGWVFTLFFGICGTMWMPGMYILAAEHSGPPELASVGLTIFMFGQYLGGMVGPILLGWVNTALGGFAVARWVVLALGIVAILLAAYLMIKDRKFVATEGEEEEIV